MVAAPVVCSWGSPLQMQGGCGGVQPPPQQAYVGMHPLSHIHIYIYIYIPGRDTSLLSALGWATWYYYLHMNYDAHNLLHWLHSQHHSCFTVLDQTHRRSEGFPRKGYFILGRHGTGT